MEDIRVQRKGPMTKAPTSTENPIESNVTTQNRHQNVDNTTITDWLRTVI